jgi:hypothetical protein
VVPTQPQQFPPRRVGYRPRKLTKYFADALFWWTEEQQASVRIDLD